MKQRIKEIVNELRGVIVDECLSVSHDTLFKEAVSCYRGEKAGESKSTPKKTMNPNEPATQKQIDFIHKNNLDVNTEQITKKEANQIIKEHIEKKNDDNRNRK